MITPYPEDRPLLDLQQQFLNLRFGMFIHFNMATYQDREWGNPKGDTMAFDPTDLDTDQWAEAALSAGMTYGCLTSKHHDGFCLWPTATASDSILKTPRKIDVVDAYCSSFRAAGLRVGLYFSILDLRADIRHFNVTPSKIQLIKDQLTELLTNYGPIDILVIDGWDAWWSRISYEEIPFSEIYRHIKSLQPNCLISELNSSRYPGGGLYYSDIKAFEQNAGEHLPSDSTLPSQSCVTLTDGWFWKLKDADAELKPVKTIVEEWLIPQNDRHCNLILNAPPDRSGRLAPNVIARLKEIGQVWKHSGPVAPVPPSTPITSPNLLAGLPIHASTSADTIGPDMASDGDFRTAWSPDEGCTDGWLEVEFDEPVTFNMVAFAEPVGEAGGYATSRISSYVVESWLGSDWEEVARGTIPQSVQTHAFELVTSNKIRFSFTGSEAFKISEIGIYAEPRALAHD